MKKITIALLAVFFIGIANINAQTETKKTEDKTEVKKACPHAKKTDTTDCPYTVDANGKKICTKTGKECSPKKCTPEEFAKCKKDSKKECQKGKSSCCKKAKKSCNKGEKKKGCCSKKGGDKKSCNKGEKKKGCCSKKGGDKKSCNKGEKKKGCCSKKGGDKKGCSKKAETKE
jgi:hypothetical protein